MTEGDSAGEVEDDLLADIDHVTYVCREGESLKILAFYKVGTAFLEQSDIFEVQFFSILCPAMDFGHYTCRRQVVIMQTLR